MQSMAKRDDAAIIESVVVKGDLEKLSPAERVSYYRQVCESLGLNPFTQPFGYLKLSGKLTLYAKKDAAEQLRKINQISVYKIEKEQDGDLFMVTAYARTPDGREDIDLGAVSTKNKSGDDLVNARLKAITKAKRRVTLSICGLGFLDETEIETIPQAQAVTVTHEGEIVEASKPAPVAASEPMATHEQKAEIGRIWTELKRLEYFADDAACGESLLNVIGKPSRSDLTEREAEAYLKGIRLTLNRELDARAQQEEAR